MSDLFDQLKSAGPVKKTQETPLKISPLVKKQESPLKTSSLVKKQETPLKTSSPVKKTQETTSKTSSLVKKKQETSSKTFSLDKKQQEAPLKILSPVKKQQEAPLKTSPVKRQQEVPLKTSSPVKKHQDTPLKTPFLVKKKQDIPLKTSSQPSKDGNANAEKFNSSNKSSSSGTRRESMPTSTAGSLGKKGKNRFKARSLSPPKFGVETVIKSLKVKLERKKFEKFLIRPLDEHANNIRVKHDKDDKHPKKTTPKDDKQPKKIIPMDDKHPKQIIPIDDKLKKMINISDKQPKKNTLKDDKQPKKITPTKAQQKLFEPPLGQKKTKAQLLREFNVKSCKVRIHRDNLNQLLRDFKDKNENKSKTAGNKRSATSFLGSPPLKKGKLSSPSTSKPKSNFFIKLNTSPPSKLEKKLKNLARSSSAMAHHNKIKNSKTTITTPTKFSRSQLIRSFGQRFFNVHVKIERCTHPLMLTFVSNNRARCLQSKRNKSKNLSVSFREQVEVFGSSSDSDDNYDEDFCAIPNRNARKNTSHNSKGAPATPVVMPARLKKVENGKVVDDIELDPSLFIDPNYLVASTPFSPGRKKRDHKSYSPLKDEGTPSPRKEQLKLANEKIPPSGLRRLNIDDDDDDDEDDDCEYIVPIEMPQHRISRTSSNTTLDGVTNVSMPPLAESTAMFTDEVEDLTEEHINNIGHNIDTNNIVNNIIDIQAEKSNEPIHNENNQLETISDDSFQSENDVTEQNKAKSSFASDKFPTITSLQNTPTLELNDALDMAEEEEANNQMESIHSPQKNGDLDDGDTNDNNVDFNVSRKPMNAIDDLSMNLFLEDSQSNENDNHSKSFVDSLINETIDKLTKDIDEGPPDEQFTN